MTKKAVSLAWIIILLLALAEGVFALFGVASLRSDGGVFLGYSLQRLVILVAVFLLVSLTGYLLFASLKKISWTLSWLNRLASVSTGAWLLLAGSGLVLVPQVGLDLLSTLYQSTDIYRYFAYFERLSPVLNWFSLVGLQMAVLALVVNGKAMVARLRAQRAVFALAGAVLLLFLLVASFVLLTGIGVRRDTTGSWGNPAIPPLEWQIWLAAGIAFLSSLLFIRFGPSSQVNARLSRFFRRPVSIDVLLAVAIWVICAGLWVSTPLVPGYIATPPRAPNFEIYPFSDAATYDRYAQSILIGNGLAGQVPQRALYTLLLAAFHLVAGQGYLNVILVQSLVLAVLPVILYFIGKEIHSRPVGIFVALLVILRDIAAAHVVPFTDDPTYSKLYLSEIPTAICLGLSMWMFLRWLKDPSGRKISALASGGFLGMAMLIRTQSLVALPVYLLLGWFALRGRRIWKEVLVSLALLALGLALCVSPWLARNARVAGGLILDNSETQTMIIAQRYNNIPFENPIPHLPGESEAAYASRLTQMTLQAALKNPAESAAIILGHFINNEIDNALLFPIRFRMDQPAELLWPDTAFWQSWAGVLDFRQALLLLANLAVIATGIAAAWRAVGIMGLIPLGANLVYNFSTAVFRSSGERFLVPVDWIVFLYFAAGLVQAFVWLLALVRRDAEKPFSVFTPPEAFSMSRAAAPRFPVFRLAAASLLFLAVGSLLPLSEIAFPVRYPPQSKEQIVDALLANETAAAAAGGQLEAIRALAQQPDTIVARGRALYPRFFDAGEFEPKTALKAFTVRSFPRMVFYVVGDQNTTVFLPLKGAPSYFPNTADITFIACQQDGYIEPVMVLLDQGKAAYLNGNPIPTSCNATP